MGHPGSPARHDGQPGGVAALGRIVVVRVNVGKRALRVFFCTDLT
jgi:hypothetical protein